MNDRISDSEFQAKLFGTYFLKQKPNQRAIDLYGRAIEAQDFTISNSDQAVLEFTLKHPWSLRFMDAGLALTQPQAELRRRLFVMLAILEATPEYCNYFLPQCRSWTYSIAIAFSGVRAATKAVAGILLLKVVR